MNKAKLIMLGIILLASLSLVSALTIKSATSNPETVQPGEQAEIRLSVENNMKEDAEDVAVSLNLNEVPFAPYQSSNQETEDEIEEDEDETFTFNLIASSDAESGTYKIPVEINYRIDNKTFTDKSLISLRINADPEIEVNSESILIKGQKRKLTVEIINSGLGKAKVLSLELQETLGIKIIGKNKVYIGNLEGDDFDVTEFDVKISENAASEISLPVKISYRSPDNSKKIENKNLKLRTYSVEEAVSLGLIEKSNLQYIIIGILIAIALFFIYRKLKKKKK